MGEESDAQAARRGYAQASRRQQVHSYALLPGPGATHVFMAH